MFKKLNKFGGFYSLTLLSILITVFPIYSKSLLNVSFDTTREVFDKINLEFKKIHNDVTIYQSHGGSSRQAGYVIAGLRADIVCLALPTDIQSISKRGFISNDWKNKKPNLSNPFYSIVVFLVRKGNPKKIQDWKDLERKDISIISPNPKTSGGGKWNFLAIYGYALDKFQGDKEKSFSYLKEFYSRIPVMDTGSRGAAATFIQRNMGDVLLIWESEAFLALKESSNKNFEIIYPSITIKTTPVISVVNRSNNLKNTSELSNTYLDFLYNETSQRIFAESGFRPIHSNISKEFANKFPVVHFFTAEEKFMNWELIQEEIFEKGKLADGVLK